MDGHGFSIALNRYGEGRGLLKACNRKSDLASPNCISSWVPATAASLGLHDVLLNVVFAKRTNFGCSFALLLRHFALIPTAHRHHIFESFHIPLARFEGLVGILSVSPGLKTTFQPDTLRSCLVKKFSKVFSLLIHRGGRPLPPSPHSYWHRKSVSPAR